MTVARYVVRLAAVDQPGIIHALSGGIAAEGGNILESAQFADTDSGPFSLRIKFEAPLTRDAMLEAIVSRVSAFDPVIQLRVAGDRRRALIMVSQLDHCLEDLLYRHRRGELSVDIPLIVSNHELLRDEVERAGIPFMDIPVSPGTKRAAEQRLLDLAQQYSIDFIILARYTQVLSDEVCARYSGRITGRFDPVLVPKRKRRLEGIDQIVLSLSARGLTTGEIAAHFDEVYGAKVSKDTISRITEKVAAELAEWSSRPLDALYPVILVDAIVVKVRDGQVRNTPFYVVMGVTTAGGREISASGPEMAVRVRGSCCRCSRS